MVTSLLVLLFCNKFASIAFTIKQLYRYKFHHDFFFFSVGPDIPNNLFVKSNWTLLQIDLFQSALFQLDEACKQEISGLGIVQALLL